MRKTLFSSLVLVLTSFTINAQNEIRLQVQYLLSSVGNISNWNLSICQTKSFYENVPGTEYSTNENHVYSPHSVEHFLVKDNERRFLFYNRIINGKYFFIKDSLNTMKWNLGKDEKTILGYKCHSATTSFRGRDYVAYYSSAIPIPDGPFKFGGLPGLILEIKSNDQEFSFTAIKITDGSAKCKDENYERVAQESFITFAEYRKVFVSEWNLKIKKLKSIQTEDEKGYPSWMKHVMPEIIYPALQTGQGIQY